MKTITREELKAKMDRGEDFVLFEALGEASYRRGHLPGAIRLQDTGAAAEVVPDEQAFIVAYCSNFNWHSSTRVVRELTAMGYENAYEYEGGKEDWIEAGYPIESEVPWTRKTLLDGTRTVSFQSAGDHLEAFSVDLFANRYRAVYLAPPSEKSRLI